MTAYGENEMAIDILGRRWKALDGLALVDMQEVKPDGGLTARVTAFRVDHMDASGRPWTQSAEIAIQWTGLDTGGQLALRCKQWAGTCDLAMGLTRWDVGR